MLAILAVAQPARRSHAVPGTWLLSPADMKSVVGDAEALKCKSEIKCEDRRLEEVEGVDVCVYYVTSLKRQVCCDSKKMPPEGDCKAGNGSAACQDKDGNAAVRRVSNKISDKGDCRSCDGTGFTDDGNSADLRDATGKVCMAPPIRSHPDMKVAKVPRPTELLRRPGPLDAGLASAADGAHMFKDGHPNRPTSAEWRRERSVPGIRR